MSENKDVIFASIQVHGRLDSVRRPQGLSLSEESLPSGMALVSWMESAQERAWGGPARRRHREGGPGGSASGLALWKAGCLPGLGLVKPWPWLLSSHSNFLIYHKGE